MKHFMAAALALFIGLSLPAGDAEARRFGGGISSGMNRSVTPPPKPRAAAPATSKAAPATAAQPGKRSWLGPLAGIAGAIGLAALFSSLGLGEEMADFLMILLLVIGAFMLFRWLMGRPQKPAAAMGYGQPNAGGAAGAPPPASFNEPLRFRTDEERAGDAEFEQEPSNPLALPAGFDAADFIRHAKRNFIRLQAANDAGDLEDIRDFTTPEMYAEIKLQFGERDGVEQRTDVVRLDAEILDYAVEDQREILSVRFQGEIRENDSPDSEPFDEVWHLTRPVDRSRHWVIAGIQQLD